MKNDTNTVKPPFFAVFRGVVTAIFITLAALLCCAAIMTYSDGLDENAIYIALYITSLAAVFAGSLTAARRVQSRGMLNGIAVGLFYTLIMVFTGFMMTPNYCPGTRTLLTLGISLSSGAIGGILGINLK